MQQCLGPTVAVRGSEKILLVDDDSSIRKLLVMLLKDEGFDVVEAATVEAAQKVLRTQSISLVIADLRLGDGDGLDLVREVSATPDVGVIILSGKSESVDRIIGLEVGADDYITKPFNNRELVARVKRHAARIRMLRAGLAKKVESEPTRLGAWIVDPARHAVYDEDGNQPMISEAEFRTLACLVRHRGTVLSRDEIHSHVVGPGDRNPLDRRIDVYVSNLRKKLGLGEVNGIRTVHRVGYIVD